MLNIGPAELAVILLASGFAAGLIARSHFGPGRSFRLFFVLGVLFPIAGVLGAYLIKRYVPRQAPAQML